MSRKKKSRYESFSFGGQTYAPESVWFKLNDKPIKIADHNKKVIYNIKPFVESIRKLSQSLKEWNVKKQGKRK